MHAAVLGIESNRSPLLGLAEVARVDNQTLVTTLHFEHKPGDRSVGNHFEAGANTTFDRVDKPTEMMRN